MRCPKCNDFTNVIIDSRPVDNVNKRRRRYKCFHCDDTRFSTIEIQVNEYKALLLDEADEEFKNEIKELRIIIDWILRCVFSERMNNNYLALKKYVNKPSQEMQNRLKRFEIDISSYQ